MQAREGAALRIRAAMGGGLTGEVKEGGLLYLKTFLDKQKGKLPLSEIKKEDLKKKKKDKGHLNSMCWCSVLTAKCGLSASNIPAWL